MMRKKIILIGALLIGCSRVENKSSDARSDLRRVADSCYSAQNWEKSVIHYKELLQTEDSLSGQFYYKIGFSYMRLGSLENSSIFLRKSIEKNYRKADAYYILGTIEMVSLNDSLAIYYLQEALKLNPNDIEAQRVLKTCKDALKKDKSI